MWHIVFSHSITIYRFKSVHLPVLIWMDQSKGRKTELLEGTGYIRIQKREFGTGKIMLLPTDTIHLIIHMKRLTSSRHLISLLYMYIKTIIIEYVVFYPLQFVLPWMKLGSSPCLHGLWNKTLTLVITFKPQEVKTSSLACILYSTNGTLQMTPSSMTLWPWPWLCSKNSHFWTC